MFETNDSTPAKRIKSERHVMAGKARQADIQRRLGPKYRQYQADLYQRTLDLCPHFHSLGAHASQAAQRAKGPAYYRAARQRGYLGMRDKLGPDRAQRLLRRVHENRRLWRLDHPTAGERELQRLLRTAGYRLSGLREHFDYLTYLADPTLRFFAANDALIEASIGTYTVDVLFPAWRLVIEVYGGVHRLQVTRDAERVAWLEQRGLRVLTIASDKLTTAWPMLLEAIVIRTTGAILV